MDRKSKTLIKQGLDFEQKSLLYDRNGLSVILQETPVLFVNIYAPNKMHEQEAFLKKLERKMASFDFGPNCKSFIGGDFNICFDDSLDCLGGNPKINKQKSECGYC